MEAHSYSPGRNQSTERRQPCRQDRLGKGSPSISDIIENVSTQIEEESGDPYQHEPDRHRALRVHSDTPMNAETPSHLLTKQWCTSNSLFYVRHHHPVPYLTDEQVDNYKLIIDVSAYQRTNKKDSDRSAEKTALTPDEDGVLRLSLDQLKTLPKTEIIATLQCSGNRRTGFNAYQRTTGTPWGQGAVSTAKFRGVLLKDLLRAAGLDDPVAAQDEQGLNHVQFDALDGMLSSINIEKACSPYGDVLVAHEMNDAPLPRDHGFPLRVIVPGYAAVRSVKWLSRIAVQKDEATGPWQRGLNYKVLPPNVTDATGQNLSEMPSIMESSIYSGITNLEVVDVPPAVCPGDRVTVQARGWAWSGGGRKIVRVDVTGDQGKSWVPSKLLSGADQRPGRAWAWTFWEVEVPGCVVQEDGTVRLASKAIDSSLNSQPENSSPTWNVRGLNNCAWYRAQTRVCAPEHI
jgi:sulfite oxidase